MTSTSAQARPLANASVLGGTAAALVTVALWTTWLVGTRAAVAGQHHLDPGVLVFIRFASAALLLAPAWLKVGIRPRGLSGRVIAGLLFAGPPYALLIANGLRFAPAAEAGPLLPGAMPLFVAILAVLILRERLTAIRVIGLALVALGVLAIAGHGVLFPTGDAWIGHLMVLSGAFCWAVYTIAFRKSGLSGAAAAGLVGVWSVILMLPFIWTGVVPELLALPTDVLFTQIVIQGLLGGVVALVTFGIAVRLLGPSRAAAITALTPAAATLAAIPVLGEIPSVVALIGCAATFMGVLLASGAIGARR